MNILIDLVHPAHVHLIKNTYYELKNKGHNLFVTVRDNYAIIELLNKFEIPHIIFKKKRDSLLGKLIMQFEYNIKLLSLVYQKKITIGFGSSVSIAQISKFSKMKAIFLDDDDDEVEPLVVKYAHPFVNTILSPDCLKRKSTKTIYYPGFHELAYLHPNRFTPDKQVLFDLNLKENEVFFVLRFNVFKAHHDIGIKGLSIETKRKLIQFLEKKGRVFITTEREIEQEFKKYQIKVSQEKIHSLLYYATMFIGDSQTMTSEAAVLGTPSIRCNSFVGRISYLEEEEHKYSLTFGFKPDESEKMFMKIQELLENPDLKKEWAIRRNKLLADKIDVTAFFVWFIENHPQSVKIAKTDPNFHLRFS
jgi:predicted glycosyltransferase